MMEREVMGSLEVGADQKLGKKAMEMEMDGPNQKKRELHYSLVEVTVKAGGVVAEV